MSCLTRNCTILARIERSLCSVATGNIIELYRISIETRNLPINFFTSIYFFLIQFSQESVFLL